MENIVIIVVLAVIVGAAAGYVIYSKRKGKKCIGCPGDCENCKSDCRDK